MAITLKWLNSNKVALDSIKIYRGTTRNNITTLVDTLAGTATTYTDTTAVNDTLYFYRIDALSGSDTASSNIQAQRNITNLGPGPATLLRGDYEFGLFGDVAASLLPDFNAIRTAAGVGLTPIANPSNWLKWIINGRIIYIPNNSFRLGTGDNIAALGKLCVARGSDRIANGAKLSLNSSNFLARLPYASNLVDNDLATGIVTASSGTTVNNLDSSFGTCELQAIYNSLTVAENLGLSKYGKMSDMVLLTAVATNSYFWSNTFITNAASGANAILGWNMTPSSPPLVLSNSVTSLSNITASARQSFIVLELLPNS